MRHEPPAGRFEHRLSPHASADCRQLFSYKGQILSSPLRIDLIVAKTVIVECKATSQYNSVFESQTLTYLRLTGLKLGLVINFGERLVKDGIHRVVNDL
ncbi:MAG: GxxExxY protein [Planctomycetota bacterium]